MLIKQVSIFCALLLAGISFHSCTYDYEENKQCSIIVPDTIFFSLDVLPIFRAHCTDAECHVGKHPAGNLNLEDSMAYEELSRPGSGYINTSKPTHSILYSMMNSPSDPMPPTGKLEQCKIDLILKWIEQGAKNN